MLERIYMLHARAQSGKDTCAAIMKEEYEKRGKRVIVIAFADYVRWCLDKYYGVTDYKTPEGRTIIQHFATDLVRKNDPTFWGRTVGDLLRAIEDDFDYAIIPDWRFKNEYTSLGQVILNAVGFKYIADKICDFGDWLIKSKGEVNND